MVAVVSIPTVHLGNFVGGLRFNRRPGFHSRSCATRTALGQQGVDHLKELPIAKHFDLPLLLRHPKDQSMDGRPRPGDLILNRYDQQRSGETVHAREARWQVSRFFKSDVEEEMTDP
jgi:hypothetical protein